MIINDNSKDGKIGKYLDVQCDYCGCTFSREKNSLFRGRLNIEKDCCKSRASKLLKSCINWCKKNQINEITTWSDNRWSTGNVYEKMGFSLDKHLPPDYSYVNITKKALRLSKQSQKKQNSQRPDNFSEVECAAKNNLARIWDCGKKRWILKVEDF